MSASWKSADRHTPSQAELDSMMQAADRIHITEIRPLQKQSGRSGVLFETTNRQEIAQLQQCLQILEDPQTSGWCMCAGDLAIIFSRGKDALATIGLHHGLSIRWDRWKFDARLADGSKIVNWLADHGMPGFKQQREESLRRSEEARKAYHHFFGWNFRQHSGSAAQLLPSELKRRLMEHVVQSGDADKLVRAQRFGN